MGKLLRFAWMIPALCYAAVTVRLGYLFFVRQDINVIFAHAMFSLPSSLLATRISEGITELIFHEVNSAVDFFVIFIFGLAQYMALGMLIRKWLKRIYSPEGWSE